MLKAYRNATAGALWSLIYRQGDTDTDEAALVAIAALSHRAGTDHPEPRLIRARLTGPSAHVAGMDWANILCSACGRGYVDEEDHFAIYDPDDVARNGGADDWKVKSPAPEQPL